MVTTEHVVQGTMQLVQVRRGVDDAPRAAEFYGWLLDHVPQREGSVFRLPCANGELVLHEDSSTPVAIELSCDGPTFRGSDPDGVPVSVSRLQPDRVAGSVTLDHVRLNCADLSEATRFYRNLGFVVTWSGAGDESLEGSQERPLAGASWLHVSGTDGYLSLSQADWKDTGVHTRATGPPRFIHVGFAVHDLAAIRRRLKSAAVSYLRSPSSEIGHRLYLNDPEGDRRLGTNIELVEYTPGVARSGSDGALS